MTSAQLDVGFDPADAETVRNPYPAYDQLRARDPVHWNPKGFWFLSRYEDVQSCLNDPRFSNRPAPFALVHARNKDRFAAADVANNLIAFKDAPEHPKLRGWVARCFARHIQKQEEMLQALAQDCSASFERGASIEFVSAFALPFSARAICTVLGLPQEDHARVAAWSEDFFRLFHAIPNAEEFARLNESLLEFRAYVLAVLDQRRVEPRSDFLSELAGSVPAGTTDAEIADNVMLLAADGVGNVQSGLSNCMSILIEQPQLPKALFGSAKERACLVDECLRLESPGQYQGRITSEPVDIGGKSIRANAIVLLGLAAANRDPCAFAEPDLFDPSRTRPQHLAFGSGAHMCMGNVLVRREICAALECLFADGRTFAPVQSQRDWLVRPGHRWMGRFDLKVEGVA